MAEALETRMLKSAGDLLGARFWCTATTALPRSRTVVTASAQRVLGLQARQIHGNVWSDSRYRANPNRRARIAVGREQACNSTGRTVARAVAEALNNIVMLSANRSRCANTAKALTALQSTAVGTIAGGCIQCPGGLPGTIIQLVNARSACDGRSDQAPSLRLV